MKQNDEKKTNQRQPTITTTQHFDMPVLLIDQKLKAEMSYGVQKGKTFPFSVS